MLHDAVTGLAGGGDTNLECVIVDDGSMDGTTDMANALRAKWGDYRVVYLRQEQNLGAQCARNRGIEESKGRFLLFMDSDDVAVPEGIFVLQRHLEARPDLDYCFGRVQKTDAELKPLESGGVVGEAFQDKPREIAGYHWHTMGALYRRECVERVGPWNPKLSGSQDWEYQARVKLFGGKGEFVDTLVGYWRQHAGDRVGATKFRPDYLRSVMLACDSILSMARRAGRCDMELEQRIAKKLIVHALEWGENGCVKERKECFMQAASCLTSNLPFKPLIRLWGSLPASGDAWQRKLITGGARTPH